MKLQLGMVHIVEFIGEKKYNKTLDKIMETPHTPTLKALGKINRKLFLLIHDGEQFQLTNERVKAKKVGEFCYVEEESFAPIRKRSDEERLNLSTIEIDTKILRQQYPELDFDAYHIEPIGQGLNLDALTRISGTLYKIKT